MSNNLICLEKHPLLAFEMQRNWHNTFDKDGSNDIPRCIFKMVLKQLQDLFIHSPNIS